jgi:predicted acetyltransferase
MTKRDFFIIMLKLLGLYAVIQLIFTQLPYSVVSVFFGESSFRNGNFFDMLVSLVTGIFALWLLYTILVKPMTIINFFGLDKGFDEDRIEFGQLSRLDVLKIGIVILGGYLFLNNIIDFVVQCYYGLDKYISNHKPITRFYFSSWLVYGLNSILGFVLLSKYASIAKSIDRNADGSNPYQQ